MDAVSSKRILIVEDEKDVVDLLSLNLRKAGGFVLSTAPDGAAGLAKARAEKPDFIILDLMLPKLSGLDICKEIRRDTSLNRLPILMLTARGEEADRVVGLEMGADDYITKPLSFPELLARIEAALRRAATTPVERPRRIQYRDLVADVDEHHVFLRTAEVHLTPTEFRLLIYLLEHAGQLVTHRQVLGAVWGGGYSADVHLLRMTIRNLRHKLDAVTPGESYIATEYGLGYRLTGASAPVKGAPSS